MWLLEDAKNRDGTKSFLLDGHRNVLGQVEGGHWVARLLFHWSAMCQSGCYPLWSTDHAHAVSRSSDYHSPCE